MRHDRDPVTDARDLVVELFLKALWALVTGSVLTDHRTDGSGLDIVVVLADGDPRAPYRSSRHYRDWPVELLVHYEPTLAHYLAKDVAARRPTMIRMLATGKAVLGDPGDWPDRCMAMLTAGPPPLTDTERAHARYSLTDLLDALTHAIDPAERTAVAAAAWTAVAQHALALAGHWTGHGKWLLRELRDLDPALARRWIEAHGDAGAIAALGSQVLDRHGGRLFAGHHVKGERPAMPTGR